ncbi:glycosyltransferase family 2 protein, partial [Campylobacter coli]|nr:glycosyltransferase family 2 protein [Campylobacter coli]
MNDTIAVILATYNGEKYLKQQIESILDQTYKNIKIYIGDDCSKDGTIDIIRAYKNLYPDKIIYYQNETNIGFVKNFEKLLQNTKEDYIAFSDQDDVWDKDKIFLQYSALKEKETIFKDKAMMIHHDLEVVDSSLHKIFSSYFDARGYKFSPNKDVGVILGPCGVMGNTIFMNKKLKSIVLPFPEMLDSHDYWIAVNCEFFGIRVSINKALIKYRIHMLNTSNKKNIFFQGLTRNKLAYLPNHNTTRKVFLKKLVNRVNSQDKIILTAYLSYLELKGNKINLYINLIKFNL